MIFRSITMALVATAMTTLPVQRAQADVGDAIVGGVIGGVIGGAIVNNQNQKKKKVYVKKSGVSSFTRAQNRETQTSLNYFGFPAGTPDGVLGRNSRSAISQYQAFMGYPATGYLTVYERDFLVTSYHRAISGGYATTQQVASNPMGAKGLLKSYQQQQFGVAQPNTGVPVATQPGVVSQAPFQAATPPVTSAPNAATTVVVAPAPTTPGTQTTTTTVTETTAVGTGSAMPNFLGSNGGVSLASHCNKVNLLTNTNGGYMTEATMSDPNAALNEQFCMARTYAITQGEDLITKVSGFSPAQIEAQCKSFGPALKEYVASLSLKPEDQVLKDVSGFILSSGMAPAQLSGTAKICLSVGYRTDDMDVAVGSALILAALGEKVYSELPGHHLSQGIGASKRPDLALAWYESSLNALDSGAMAVFQPGQPERTGLIRKAAYQVGGKSDGAAISLSVDPPATQPASLPTFPVPN